MYYLSIPAPQGKFQHKRSDRLAFVDPDHKTSVTDKRWCKRSRSFDSEERKPETMGIRTEYRSFRHPKITLNSL